MIALSGDEIQSLQSALDQDVKKFTKGVEVALRSELDTQGISSRRKRKERTVTRVAFLNGQIVKQEILAESLRGRVRRADGSIERVAWSFVRHGIFIEHGVGKHRAVGSAAAERAKQPWLSKIIPTAVDQLADILEERYADLAVANLKITIPGVLETRVRKV